MTHYKIDWTSYPTDEALDQINVSVGATVPRQILRPVVAAICRAAGGLPVTDAVHDETTRTALTLRLVAEGVVRLISRSSATSPEGYVRESLAPGGPLAHELVPAQKININTATEEALQALPEIGAERARRIVQERQRAGFFTSLEALAGRVSGVGPGAVEAIRYRVVVDDPAAALSVRPSMPTPEVNLGWLVARMGGDTVGERLLSVLDMVASTCADSPHPSTTEYQPRTFDLGLPAVDINAQSVALLNDSHYYTALQELLQQATATIDVCMFHIAMPSANHPTRNLLDALVQAHGSGHAVRVLMDADKLGDPYLSTVINTPAKDYLQLSGVPVKFDQPDALLHSKFVVIDKTWTVIGSHNWSAGSYFQFDDLSVAIESSEFATQITTRFEALWAAAG